MSFRISGETSLKQILIVCYAFTSAAMLWSCNGGGGDGAPQLTTVTAAWTGTREEAVNSAGGGYKVYYSNKKDFDIGDRGVQVVNVPFVSGATAPTSTRLRLLPGTYYVKAIAYAATHAWDKSGGKQSSPSAEIAVHVP